MKYFTSLRQIFFYIFIWYFRIARYLGFHHKKKAETFLDIEYKYTHPLTTRFSASFLNSEIKYNENIDSIFYDKVKYNSYMQDQNTDIEKIWRTRILLENTPRGNVLMFYDAFKMGFSYYSDEKTISYDVLNAIAMKYVIVYRCRDFHVDESVVSKTQCSPFIKLYLTEEPKKNEANKTSAVNPFMNTRKENPNAKVQLKKCDIGINKNKFLYLGKMNNHLFLQPVSKSRRVLAKFTSPLLESIRLESGANRETISYKDYKRHIELSCEENPTTQA